MLLNVTFAKVTDLIEKLSEIKFKDKNISDILNMTVDEGLNFLRQSPQFRAN